VKPFKMSAAAKLEAKREHIAGWTADGFKDDYEGLKSAYEKRKRPTDPDSKIMYERLLSGDVAADKALYRAAKVDDNVRELERRGKPQPKAIVEGFGTAKDVEDFKNKPLYTDKSFDEDGNLTGYKKGGAVKSKGINGIAKKGHTKGKFR
jgi:hypothetical protein